MEHVVKKLIKKIHTHTHTHNAYTHTYTQTHIHTHFADNAVRILAAQTHKMIFLDLPTGTFQGLLVA